MANVRWSGDGLAARLSCHQPSLDPVATYLRSHGPEARATPHKCWMPSFVVPDAGLRPVRCLQSRCALHLQEIVDTFNSRYLTYKFLGGLFNVIRRDASSQRQDTRRVVMGTGHLSQLGITAGEQHLCSGVRDTRLLTAPWYICVVHGRSQLLRAAFETAHEYCQLVQVTQTDDGQKSAIGRPRCG